MYTAHYQGTAQVAVIAGLAESSGPLKAPKKFSGANCFLARRGHGLRPALRLAPPTYLKRTAGAEPASIFAGQVITLCHLQGFCRPGFQHSPDCERIRDLTLFRQSSGKDDVSSRFRSLLIKGEIHAAIPLSTSTTRVLKYLALSVHGTFSWFFLCSGESGARECSIKSLSVYKQIGTMPLHRGPTPFPIACRSGNGEIALSS